jgi:hypothetical protein
MLDDDNKETLARLAEAGDNLTVPRDLDFSVVFAYSEGAKRFIDQVKKKSKKVSLTSGEDGVFDVTVTFHMLPDIDQITRHERELASIAHPLGGNIDGWGCFPVLE